MIAAFISKDCVSGKADLYTKTLYQFNVEYVIFIYYFFIQNPICPRTTKIIFSYLYSIKGMTFFEVLSMRIIRMREVDGWWYQLLFFFVKLKNTHQIWLVIDRGRDRIGCAITILILIALLLIHDPLLVQMLIMIQLLFLTHFLVQFF